MEGEEAAKAGRGHACDCTDGAHGNYDLGAAIFAEKFQREIRMVRAPEPDRQTARHLDETLKKTGAGAVRVDYVTDTTSLSFDLLQALRENQIVSIQGDRVVGEPPVPRPDFWPRSDASDRSLHSFAGRRAPIFPLFIVRLGYRHYKIVVRDPIRCERRRKFPPRCKDGRPFWKKLLGSTGTNGSPSCRHFREMETRQPNDTWVLFRFSALDSEYAGGDATRSEGNWIEAYFVGVVVY